MSIGVDVVRGLHVLDTSIFPQRVLSSYGLALLVLSVAGLVWSRLDQRRIDGEAVAVKPTRFLVSIAAYMLTASWMFNFVRTDRASALRPQATVWLMVIGCTVELSCIIAQAFRGRRSHFNISTALDARIYAIMGVFAVLFVGAVVPLAVELAARPRPDADPAMVWAVVWGLAATCLVGGGTGVLMSARMSHAVGAEGGRLPLFGWNLSGGDLRPPHFLGIHAMQALPMIAGLALWLSPERSGVVTLIGALAYGLATAWLLYQALAGRPAMFGLKSA